jgi:alpha-1,6-mannosyltransferase
MLGSDHSVMAQVHATATALKPSPLGLRAGPTGRHVVDVTLLFTPTSGGVRRYLLAKHDWLRSHTRLRHSILVPGPRSGGLPYDVMSFASPAVPFGGGYRIPVRMRALRNNMARIMPDLIEVGDPYHLAWQALRVAQERRLPAVAFCHSDVITLARTLLGAPAGAAAARYLGRLYARFDKVFAPSALVAERLFEAGVREVEIQSLGVDVATLTPSAREPAIRETLGIPPGARILVFAGRMSPEKRTRDLIAAMELLGPAYHLLLIGARRAARRGRNVTLLEYQQDPGELARILASCDAFVHAGDQETFGLVVLEAMACGLPVVAAGGGALVELVDETVGATFQPRNPAALARAVAALFERDRAALGRGARRRAEAHSWDSAFTRLLGHYTRLLSSAPIPAQRAANAG